MKSEDVIKGEVYFDRLNNREVQILDRGSCVRYARDKRTQLFTYVNVKNLEPIKQTMEKETHDFSNAKVGDKVTCLVFGRGIISDIRHCDEYAITVKFNNDVYRRYATDGRYLLEHNQCLYHGHVDFKIETTQVCSYKEGEWIAVSYGLNYDWFIVQFKSMSSDGDVGILDPLGAIVYFPFHKKLSEFNG